VWFEKTQAVTPLAGPELSGDDQMWPFGL